MEIFKLLDASFKGGGITILHALTKEQLDKSQGINKWQKKWLDSQGFVGRSGQVALFPDASGGIDKVFFGWDKDSSMWDFAKILEHLPISNYALDDAFVKKCKNIENIILAWALGSYEYTRYKVSAKKFPFLIMPKLGEKREKVLLSTIKANYHIRDWINTPAEDYGPEELVQSCRAMAEKFKAEFNIIKTEDLIKENYPLVHAVGRAGDRGSFVINMSWGSNNYPTVVLVGKGICFDTGGLQVKPHQAMYSMKKDMGGAAHMMALAQMIMENNLPVNLQLWIGAADNAIAGNAYRPSDIFSSRKGVSVEIGHTDAEGRLVLADLLTAATSKKVDLVIDYATLTGAQRVALGLDLPAIWSNNDKIAKDLQEHGDIVEDPLWHMPLFKSYCKELDSDLADIKSTGNSGYAGAIIAALFLEKFLDKPCNWVHIDAGAYNIVSRPGRPKGGEAMGNRALFSYLQDRYKS